MTPAKSAHPVKVPGVRYVPPFHSLRDHIRTTTIAGESVPNMTNADVKALIMRLLIMVDVDEPWHLAQYPDIAEAVRDGRTKSAREQFINNGYFEGRLPFRITVQEAWCLSQNPTVAQAVADHQIESAQAHFETLGYREGRLPFPV